MDTGYLRDMNTAAAAAATINPDLAAWITGLDADMFHTVYWATRNNGRALRDGQGNLRSFTDEEQALYDFTAAERRRRGI